MARESPGHSLNPSDLIHEAYFKLCDFRNPRWNGRRHFFVVASKVMREILIDHARKKRCVKQGGEYRRVALDDAIHEVQDSTNPISILLLDRGLTNLSQIDDRKAQVIELWYFGGMTAKEIADTLDISAATVNRDMDIARAFLAKEIRRGEHDQTNLE
jgi:RNA polymerase sigma factor (TIGR02999 family)